jgi:hypothetical protein
MHCTFSQLQMLHGMKTHCKASSGRLLSSAVVCPLCCLSAHYMWHTRTTINPHVLIPQASSALPTTAQV